MRRGLLVIALLGCSHPRPTGPAWPRPQASERDGGESLAPREAARAISALEEDRTADRAAPDKPAQAPETATPPSAPSGDKPATGTVTGTVTVSEEPITAEDMVIEVDDPDRP